MNKQLHQTAEALKRARKVFVITGAGISAESGVPTFRGSDGLWKNYNAFDLATPEAFARDPALVWEWYMLRRGLIAKAHPNAAHLILTQWEKRFDDFLIATQNVDRLHHRAGSRKIVEIHGNIFQARCCRTGQVFDESDIEICSDALPPHSPAGGLLRPNVVWFGEMLPSKPIETVSHFFESGKPDITMIIGTTGVLVYIQSLVMRARENGSLLIEINPEETAITPWADVALMGPAVKVLTTLNDMII